MIEIAKAINSFASVAQQNNVLPSEESVFILTSGQLQDIITRAIQEAVVPASQEIAQLRKERAQDRIIIDRQQLIIDLYIDPDPRVLDPSNEDCEALKDAARKKTLASKEYGLELISLDSRIKDLESLKEPQPLQRDRGDILRALLAANNGKMLARDARKKMHLSRPRFSELLSTMGNYIETKPYHLHKNWKVLILK